MLIVGSLGAPLWSRVLKIHTYYIVPAVMALALIGSYSVRNNIFDLFVMAVCGIIGFAFTKFGFKMAPLILGFILGPLAESSFRQTLAIAQSKSSLLVFWVHRPISILLIIITLVIVLTQIIRSRKDSNKTK
jgi:putative tricarboxylic transport membrane protein